MTALSLVANGRLVMSQVRDVPPDTLSTTSLLDILRGHGDVRLGDSLDLGSAPAASYIDHLVSSPLSSIIAEPSTIAAEASTVEAELTNLCFREYSTFVSVHQCSAAVQSAFDDFDRSLERLVDSVPALEDECRTFAKRTSGIQAVRGRALAVQEQRDKLLDLLEIPQLMETCVRNGYYQEALELAQHATAMKDRYPTMELVQDVAHEVENVAQLMLSQLLALLREPVKLPSIIKAITFLRRLGRIEEADLGLLFLTSRLYNFRSHLVHIERDRADPTRYLRRYIDLFREHIYDIISQFSTIFSDSEMIVSFASQCVGDIIQLANSYIPRMASDTAAMSSILVQLGYCSLSFARIGLDFASLVGNTFAETITNTYGAGIEQATERFVTTITEATRNAAPPAEALVASSYLPDVLTADLSFEQSDENATPELALFPPIAVFLNAHITLLNSLRLLAPQHLLTLLQSYQEKSLSTATDALLAYLRQTVSNDLPNGDSAKPKHQRMPSSPRAHLLRRSTDAQLTIEMRSAKKREAAQICLTFVKAWLAMAAYLSRSLQGVFGEKRSAGDDLTARISALEAFVVEQAVVVPQENAGETLDREQAQGQTQDDPFQDSQSSSATFQTYALHESEGSADKAANEVTEELTSANEVTEELTSEVPADNVQIQAISPLSAPEATTEITLAAPPPTSTNEVATAEASKPPLQDIGSANPDHLVDFGRIATPATSVAMVDSMFTALPPEGNEPKDAEVGISHTTTLGQMDPSSIVADLSPSHIESTPQRVVLGDLPPDTSTESRVGLLRHATSDSQTSDAEAIGIEAIGGVAPIPTTVDPELNVEGTEEESKVEETAESPADAFTPEDTSRPDSPEPTEDTNRPGPVVEKAKKKKKKKGKK